MRSLRTAEAAWVALRSGNPVTPQQSESFLDTVFADEVLEFDSIPAEHKAALRELAHALQENHHDSWFKDFLEAPFPERANRLLGSALQANRVGNADRAASDASAAATLYLRAGNVAGFARSEIEAIYAYRRRSRARECVQEISALRRRIRLRAYTGFQIVADFEDANCQSMLGNFDGGWQRAQTAISGARQANYPSLKLRALTLLSAMDSEEGRFQGALHIDLDGLSHFWSGLYAPERGFQFYSDAALTAEKMGLWHLAAVLQREALLMLANTDRFDFQATAHYHLGISLQRAGDQSGAQKQFSEASSLFGKMHDNSLMHFLRGSSAVELAKISLAQGEVDAAEASLRGSEGAIAETDNFVVALAYSNARASLDRLQNRPEDEWKHLIDATEIARRGFASLKSINDRWEWYREVDRSYRRLIEFELDVRNDPAQALADWEDYRAAERTPSNLVPGKKLNQVRLFSRLEALRSSTLLSFIVLPHRVVVWVADNRGIRTFNSVVASEELGNEVADFVRLCSDQNSPLEKVNQAGSRLYQRLFQPIEQEIASDRYLAIEADGVLSRIPWPALVNQAGEYLVQKYMTVSTPGLFFAAPTATASNRIGPGLAAYPGAVEFEGTTYPALPHAEEEASFVSSIHPGSIYLRGEHVTARNLVRLLPRSSSFHFAGHAVNREGGGELLLAGKDTVFSTSSIRQLDLSQLSLAVLSACSTADSQSDITRSPYGLVQTFLSSGARHVVASRWSVDSLATLHFMKYLYGSLGQGNSLPLASKRAQERIRKNNKHPFYWSSFDVFEIVSEPPKN